MIDNVVPRYLEKRVLILGCGNLLFGDDGFGPMTAQYIQENFEIPQDICVMDVGTGAAQVLLDIALSEKRPQRLIIIDAVDSGRKPGEIFQIAVENLPSNKAGEFSLHQFPSANLLRELHGAYGLEIVIIACQAERIPPEVEPGLSEPVRNSVVEAAKAALRYARSP